MRIKIFVEFHSEMKKFEGILGEIFKKSSILPLRYCPLFDFNICLFSIFSTHTQGMFTNLFTKFQLLILFLTGCDPREKW